MFHYPRTSPKIWISLNIPVDPKYKSTGYRSGPGSKSTSRIKRKQKRDRIYLASYVIIRNAFLRDSESVLVSCQDPLNLDLEGIVLDITRRHAAMLTQGLWSVITSKIVHGDLWEAEDVKYEDEGTYIR